MDSKNLDSLQIFRGLAAILVVFYHLTKAIEIQAGYILYSGFFKFGFSGVDFFFVLSGFIIFFVHSKHIGIRSFAKEYAIKRCLRIYPTYWFVTTLLIFALLAVPALSKNNDLTLTTLINSVLLLPSDQAPILAVAWTLMHEMFFYTLFFAFIFFDKRITRFILAFWLLVCIGFLGLHVISPLLYESIVKKNVLFYYFVHHLNLEFMMGMLAAFLYLRFKITPALGLAILTTGIILFFICGIYYVYNIESLKSTRELIRVAYFGIPSMLIVWGGVSANYYFSFRALKVFKLIGDSSYMLYLIHNPIIIVIVMIGLKAGATPLLLSIAAPVTAITLGIILYQYVEVPMLRALKNAFRIGYPKPI